MDELLPSLAQLNCGNALLRVLKNVGAQELLEEIFADETLQVVQKLETFFIWNI